VISLNRALACALLLAWSLAAPLAAQEAESWVPSGPIEKLYREVLAKADEIHPQQRGLEPLAIEALFRKTSSHPVASTTRVSHYDPNNYVGFCFGRAMTAHLIARKMGVHPSAVKKLFIVGDMRTAGATATQWRFHVTTIVKARGQDEWHAIDPIMYRTMTMRAWIDHVRSTWDLGRKAHFYVVPSSVVIPDVRIVPPIATETGARIIELSFRPDGKPGFTRRADLGHNCWEADEAAAQTYFLDATEPTEPFDFAGIQINGKVVTYRNYFHDLLTSLVKPDEPARTVPLPGTVSTYVTAKRPLPSTNAGSMDFEKLLGP
jgi:hypothetical protein